MACDIDTIREVLSEKFTGDALEQAIVDYSSGMDAELVYMEMMADKASSDMMARIKGPVIVHYNHANPLVGATSGNVDVISMRYDPEADTTKVTMSDHKNYIFEAGAESSKPTKSNKGTISSTSITEAIKVGRNLHKLGSRDLTDGEIDELLLNKDVSSDTIINVQAEMRRLDSESMAPEDADHSSRLGMVVDHIMNVNKRIRDMKLTVDKSLVDEITKEFEPAGTYDPGRDRVSVVAGTRGQEARNRFRMSNEETMTHELVHASLDWVFRNETGTQGEHLKLHIRKLYKQAKDNLTWESLLTEEGVYSEIEKARAKERYNYIFTDADADGVHSSVSADIRLQEFMAHLMTNKQLQEAMEKVPPPRWHVEVKPNETIIDTAFRLFVNALSGLFIKVKKIKGKTLLEESVKVVYALTEIQDKYGSLAASKRGFSIDQKVSDGLTKVTDAVDTHATKLVDWMGEKTIGEPGKKKMSYEEWTKLVDHSVQDWPKETDNTLVKYYKMAKILPKVRLAAQTGDQFNRKDVALLWSKTFAHMGLTEDSFIRQLTADFSGGRKTLEEITDLTMEFRSHIDRMREQGYKGTLHDIVTKMFQKVDFRKKENNKYNESLEAIVMSSDLQALDIEDTNELKTLVSDPAELDKRIRELELKLIGIKNIDTDSGVVEGGQIMVDMAEASAKHMVTGKGLRTNATNITRLFGTQWAMGYGTDNKYVKHVQDVNHLVTLKALAMTSSKAKSTFAELLELDPSGVKDYMGYARGMQQATREAYDVNEPHLYVKGQVRDTIDTNKDIQVVPTARRLDMANMGYKIARPHEPSSSDIDTLKYSVYVSTNTYMTKRVDGAISLQRDTIPGLLLTDKVRMSNPNLSAKKIREKTIVAIAAASEKHAKGYKDIGMEPVYGLDGQIIDYRYGVSKEDKMTHLDLDVRGAEVLAKSEGQVGTMEMSNEQNRHLIDILRVEAKEFNESGKAVTDSSHLFLKVKAKEIDLSENDRKKMHEQGLGELIDRGAYGLKTQGEEIWGLLPPDARKYVIELNRKEDIAEIEKNIKVPGTAEYKKNKKGENLDAQIGNLVDRREFVVRKDLIAQLFGYNEASIAESNMFKKLGEKERRKLKMSESKLMEFASILKSNVVIKLPATIWNNIISNAKFLFYGGMPVGEAFKYLLLSFHSLRAWKKDEKVLARLNREYRNKLNKNRGRLASQIADLEAEMAANPLKPLMDKGMYQSIVEDVQLVGDKNSISKGLGDAADKLLGDGLLNSVVQTTFLTKRSTMGRAMVEITQESDFHFRAATYWHGVSEGKSATESMRDATDNFINYSKVINSKSIQWLDRMGPEAFWKFFANSQRVNMKLMKKTPSRVLIDKGLQEITGTKYFDADILDSNIIQAFTNRINPFHGLLRLLDGGTNVPILQAVRNGL